MTKQLLPHLHFVGISGSLMAGAAVLAKQLGYTISGSDRDFAPPMGALVQSLNIPLVNNYDADIIRDAFYIIGNAVSRGNPLVESILSARCTHISAAQWLGENVLAHKKVLAVAGTHGKTTTASLLSWMLSQAGMQPGFLLGGISQNFQTSARLGAGEWFVIESDEYDCAFFDKRPKFMHYRPQIAVLNNLEFDHADIYDSLDDIILQFHYLLRLLPQHGQVIVRANAPALQSAIDKGAYCPLQYFGRTDESDSHSRDEEGLAQWRWEYANGRMAVLHLGESLGEFVPPLSGAANRDNITAACAAAAAAGVPKKQLIECLSDFAPPLRRLQQLYAKGGKSGTVIYDDFAHHPTAYRATLSAVREMHPNHRIVAVFEPRSNTMKAGVLRTQLPDSFANADRVIAVGTQEWLDESLSELGGIVTVCASADKARQLLKSEIGNDDCVVFMSNGFFANLPRKVVADLA